jgi:hypothetical protein
VIFVTFLKEGLYIAVMILTASLDLNTSIGDLPRYKY